jgi:dipeptidyl aminopeptidase/acylaminoacyl peptidase
MVLRVSVTGRRGIALLGAIALFACSDGPVGLREEAPDQDVIAIGLSSSGNRGGIYLVQADGSALRGVHPTCRGGFAWSPDGRELMANCYGVLTLVDVETGTSRRYDETYHGDGLWRSQRLSWSPDGLRVAFDWYLGSEESYDVLVIDRDGTGMRNLTPGPDRSREPVWAPDGSRIAFSSDRDGSGVYVVPADGSQVTKVLSREGWIAWSPDSDGLAACAEEGVFVRNPLGGEERMVAATLPNGCAWSPDGSSIAFHTFEDVVVFDLDAWAMRVVLKGRRASGAVAWSPDGRRLAYLAALGGTAHALHVVTLDDMHDTTLVESSVVLRTDGNDTEFTVASWGLGWRPR